MFCFAKTKACAEGTGMPAPDVVLFQPVGRNIMMNIMIEMKGSFLPPNVLLWPGVVVVCVV